MFSSGTCLRLLLATAMTAFCVACGGPWGDGVPEVSQSHLLTTNGLPEINGLDAVNGLGSGNGILFQNGLASTNGILFQNGMVRTAAGRVTSAYLVKCALPAGRTVTVTDDAGTPYTFAGHIGLAPEWETGACSSDCQQRVSACMMAHVNTSGQHVDVWLDGSASTVGWGYTYDFPYQEGSFFGNIFVSPPQAYYCNGTDFDSATVPGRLGANQNNAPYVNPGPGPCTAICTPSTGVAQHLDITNRFPAVIGAIAPDGFTSCQGVSQVLTVYRSFMTSADYKICNRNSGLCLDIVGHSTAAGARADQTAYAGVASQKFGLTAMSNASGMYSFPTYAIANRNSGKALGPTSNRTTNDLPVQQSTFTHVGFQQWMIRPLGGGTYSVCNWGTSVGATMCLAVKDASTASGAAVVQQTYAATPNQLWTIALAD